eukprot:4390-Eustigmatos_ZCMA.PRE.1
MLGFIAVTMCSRTAISTTALREASHLSLCCTAPSVSVRDGCRAVPSAGAGLIGRILSCKGNAHFHHRGQLLKILS